MNCFICHRIDDLQDYDGERYICRDCCNFLMPQAHKRIHAGASAPLSTPASAAIPTGCMSIYPVMPAASLAAVLCVHANHTRRLGS